MVKKSVAKGAEGLYKPLHALTGETNETNRTVPRRAKITPQAKRSRAY